MKRKIFMVLMMTLLSLAVLCGCARGGSSVPNTANLDDWVYTTGGKKYESTVTGAGTEYYTDGTIEDTAAGVTFSGTGGFWQKDDGSETGAACGGVYKIPFEVKDDGFKVTFTIDELGHKNSTNSGGVWDSWFAFAFMNKAQMFNTLTDTSGQFAQGYVMLLKPFAEVSAEAEMSILVNEKGNNFVQKGDNPQENNAVVGKQHTFELKKDEDELGVFYTIYFDGRALSQGGNITEDRFNELFPDGKVYFQFYLQNWNAGPKADDGAEEKEYKKNQFTVVSIESGDEKVNF